MKNILFEPRLVSQYYTEYLNHLQRFKNYKRKSIFASYLSVNEEFSSFDKDTKITTDRYFTNTKYDMYEYTPLLNSWGIVNNLVNN